MVRKLTPASTLEGLKREAKRLLKRIRAAESESRARFEAAGCDSYWVVDPTAPSITAWDLGDGAYVEVASVTGGELLTTAHPFPVAVAPRDLVD